MITKEADYQVPEIKIRDEAIIFVHGVKIRIIHGKGDKENGLIQVDILDINLKTHSTVVDAFVDDEEDMDSDVEVAANGLDVVTVTNSGNTIEIALSSESTLEIQVTDPEGRTSCIANAADESVGR